MGKRKGFLCCDFWYQRTIAGIFQEIPAGIGTLHRKKKLQCPCERPDAPTLFWLIDHTMGMFLIQWTARWAVCGYLGRIWVEIDDRSKVSTRILARRWWTFGCVGFVLHVICAFHFAHHWSHAAAWEATARRTAEMTGWYSGWGLAVNEGFLALWICDTILWWRNLAWPRIASFSGASNLFLRFS